LEKVNPIIWFSAIFTGSALMYIAIPSLLCALVFRGGLLWWMFGLTAVTKNGKAAARWRLCWRNLVAWSPLLLAPIVLGMLAPLGGNPTVLIAFLAFAYAALVLASTFTNQRGWPDRLAGTWLVIR
jgi:small-conductance mechanosensitive channel